MRSLVTADSHSRRRARVGLRGSRRDGQDQDGRDHDGRDQDQYVRSDAANFIADVAELAPAELRDEWIELLEAGQAKDKGGLTAVGYDKSLKKLKK